MPRLLIIDDNEPIRHLMRSFIEQAGHIVCGEAQNGLEGIELAKRTLPDLILVDLTMPQMNGVETTAILKRELPDTPIILFTMYEETINRQFAAQMGADAVVSKVDGIPKLAESVKTLLARKASTASAKRAAASSMSSRSTVHGKDPGPN